MAKLAVLHPPDDLIASLESVDRRKRVRLGQMSEIAMFRQLVRIGETEGGEDSRGHKMVREDPRSVGQPKAAISLLNCTSCR